MTTGPQLTTSGRLADRLLALLTDAGFRKVEVLHPAPGLTQLGANSALIIVTEDGDRFGLEVHPFPGLPNFPTEAPRRLTDGCGPATVRGVDGSTEGA